VIDCGRGVNSKTTHVSSKGFQRKISIAIKQNEIQIKSLSKQLMGD